MVHLEVNPQRRAPLFDAIDTTASGSIKEFISPKVLKTEAVVQKTLGNSRSKDIEISPESLSSLASDLSKEELELAHDLLGSIIEDPEQTVFPGAQTFLKKGDKGRVFYKEDGPDVFTLLKLQKEIEDEIKRANKEASESELKLRKEKVSAIGQYVYYQGIATMAWSAVNIGMAFKSAGAKTATRSDVCKSNLHTDLIGESRQNGISIGKQFRQKWLWRSNSELERIMRHHGCSERKINQALDSNKFGGQLGLLARPDKIVERLLLKGCSLDPQKAKLEEVRNAVSQTFQTAGSISTALGDASKSIIDRKRTQEQSEADSAKSRMDKADENKREASQDSMQAKQTQDQMLQDKKRASDAIIQAIKGN
jgi:hypothetical protein